MQQTNSSDNNYNKFKYIVEVFKSKNLYKFFDYFGLPTFTFLAIDSLVYLSNGETDWRVWVRLFIGVVGFFVDGYLVFFHKQK